MTPAVSYPWLVAQGYMWDTVHLNYAGGAFLANVAWNELGFFALRCPGQLGISRTDSGVKVSFATARGINYRLGRSPDGSSWSGWSTNSGTGDKVEAVFEAVQPREFFRLVLEPENP